MTIKTVPTIVGDCHVLFDHYQNLRIAIRLIDLADGLPFAMATVNLPNHPLPKGHVHLKNWSENSSIGPDGECVSELLMDAGIIGEMIAIAPAGDAVAGEHKLLVKNLEAWNASVEKAMVEEV